MLVLLLCALVAYKLIMIKFIKFNWNNKSMKLKFDNMIMNLKSWEWNWLCVFLTRIGYKIIIYYICRLNFEIPQQMSLN